MRQKNMKNKNRAAAFLLAGITLFSSIPVDALAMERLCFHEHTEECYVLEENCIHVHGESCYSDEFDFIATPTNSQSATPSDAEPIECSHMCSEETGCITEKLDCAHENGMHTEDCGYLEGNLGELENGQILDQITGRPGMDMTADQLAQLRLLSLEALVQENPDKQISEDEWTAIVFIYINGESFKDGEQLTVMEGDNFSYNASWVPDLEGDMTWGEGSWFEIELFRVPNLNLSSVNKVSLSINGIKVGEYSLNYNKETGSMIYKVVFNRYVQFFDPGTILAQIQGSGIFISELEEGEISVGDHTGTITIMPRPDVPEIPSGPGGIGWKPSKAPSFKDNLYPFGKGIKWTSGMDATREPQVEWRVVFLEQVQKIQREFLDEGDSWQPEISRGNVIIKDTLDVNQEFYYPPEDSKDYKGEAPFYLELPVIVPGTGQILNGSSDVGNVSSYDGPGIINSKFKGDKFTQIDGSGAATLEKVQACQKMVENTPLSWTVTTDPRNKRQTLMINVGKLGTEIPGEGITWEEAEQGGWPEQLDKLIAECDEKILALQSGQDSPITLLHKRRGELQNILEQAVNLPENQENEEALQEKIQEWKSDYEDWYADPSVDPLKPLEKLGVDGTPELIRDLPQTKIINDLASLVVKSNGTVLKDTLECKNYLLSLDSVRMDQRIYLENRLQYGKDWENAKQHYENARSFYEYGGVFGFVVKVRSRSINTAMTTYENSVQVEQDDKNWSAADKGSITFSGGIVGNYNLGDVLVQKADQFYNETGDPVKDIQKVEHDKAGLSGAVFQMYCDNEKTETPPSSLTHAQMAHFLDRDASVNGDTYIYNHTGDDTHGGLLGEVVDLVTDEEGKLALGAIVPVHSHWLVETKAPKGYYLDSTPVLIQSDDKEVTYKLKPNISRSAVLYKTDSYSGNPVEGAEFTLYKEDGKTEITGFSSRSLNGHETLWYDGTGTERLATNAEGRLCIHGLDAGTYFLRETSAAPGYVTPEDMPEFSFTIGEEVPEKGSAGYDEAGHILLNTPDNPLKNDPGVATLAMKKTGLGNTPLSGAGFALFRFTGTEEQWNQNPDNEDWWKAVQLKATPGDAVPDYTIAASEAYFKTKQPVETIKIEGDGRWKEIQAILTEEHGEFSITDIPVGHYSVAEIKAPTDEYKRDYRSFYFTSAGTGEEIQLYTEPEELNKLNDNTLKNYQKKAQLALVKYDSGNQQPIMDGKPMGEGDSWHYTDKVLAEHSPKGLPGAVYKLFMRRGASGKVNPDPDQLKKTEILDYKAGYDTCVAKGVTDENGVLKLSEMTGKNGNKIQGLNPEEYYLIEVKAPDGYLMDQTPIHFSLYGDAFETTDDTEEPGVMKMAENVRIHYGIRLLKADEATAGTQNPQGLFGARFTVKEGEKRLYFTGNSGSYQLVNEGTVDAVEEVVTGLDGQLELSGLAPGISYTLTEIQAPTGYALPDKEKSVTIKTPVDTSDGVIDEHGVLYPKDISVITNRRLPGKVILHKQAAETGKALAGAEFALYKTVVVTPQPGDPNYDPEHPESTYSEDVLVQQGQTDENGELTFDNLEWSNSYYIIETKAPEGYVLDQSKRMFSINAYSGVDIPIRFPSVINSRGTLGRAVLRKVDAEDYSKRLEDAHFYLEKFIRTDANGEEIWVGYGQGMYKTDSNGEIHFLLPPGRYKLSEMKAPEGYVLEGMKELFFEIKDMEAGDNSELVVIDEKDSHDGVITNRRGETGIHLKKTIAGTDVAVPGVTFQIYWEHRDFLTDESIGREDVYFTSQGGGNYEYAQPSDAGATKNLVTNEQGELYIMFPKGFQDDPPRGPEGRIYFTYLVYEEVDAPAGIERPLRKADIPDGSLKDHMYLELSVENMRKEDADTPLSISIHKTDGKSRLGLSGAEFELFTYLDEDHKEYEIKKAEGITDRDGNLTFDRDINGDPLNLELGETYYVRETVAPEGYVLDETIHEITIDERHFDENFQFVPIVLSLSNYQIRGTLGMTKVSKETGEGLSGAEFELFHKVEESWGAHDEWEHYGADRYITEEHGRLLIPDLPYGTYRLIERAAPLGYLLPDPVPVFEFRIDENNTKAELGKIENAADPNPVRDVFVKKVDAEDGEKPLSGAEFELYERHEDGQYHLRQKAIYVTDQNGEFIMKKLPVGDYALKEVKAPAGYQVPHRDMTYFTVNVEDRSVQLMIENERLQGGGGDGTGLSVTVKKLWQDQNPGHRPNSVAVQLYQDGIACGEPVILNEEKAWKHTWTELDEDFVWAVDEVEVPEGYEKHVSHKGNTWTIINRTKQENSGDSGDSGGSGGSDGSSGSGYPGGSGNSSGSGGPGFQPPEQEKPVALPDFNSPAESRENEDFLGLLPQTGDYSRPLFWLVLMFLSAAGLGAAAWKNRREKERNKQ